MALDDADIQWPMELSFVRQCLQKKFRLTCLPMTGAGGGEPRKPLLTCSARRCGQTFDNREALTQHEATHKAPVMAGIESKHKYLCHHCRKEFVEHGALRRHLQVCAATCYSLRRLEFDQPWRTARNMIVKVGALAPTSVMQA
jgi:hypothetical protein